MNHNQMSSFKANILVVDDTRDNLRLLSNILTGQGYQVRPVPNGSKALSAAKARLPDLILLDIMMPDLDGYAVCEQLKADERTRDIPVIFISALNETFDKVKAFDLGGVDYIAKPFQAEEVLARVKTHLSLRSMQQQLHAQNDQLQQEIVERERVEEALREANATKDTFFSIIAHDLRSPFTALIGYAELALQSFDESSKEKMKEYITQIQSSAESVYALLENLLTWSRIQRDVMEYRPENIPLHQMVNHLVYLFISNAQQKQITFRNFVPIEISVYADANMIQTVIRNLISNAIKFTDVGGSINISARQDNQYVEVSVSDSGMGIPEVDLPKLFRIDMKSMTGTAGERGTGIGLPLCKDLVEKNGGSLWVESEPGKGTTFRFTLSPHRLPQASPPKQHDVPLSEQRNEEETPIHLRGSKLQISDLRKLTRAIVALPKEWQTELQHAVEALHLRTANSVIDRIREQNAPLADTLVELLKTFRFDILQKIFEKESSEEKGLDTQTHQQS